MPDSWFESLVLKMCYDRFLYATPLVWPAFWQPLLLLGLGAAEYDEHGKISLSGTAPPGATVRLYVDNHAAGQAVANADGQWSLATGDVVDSGTHRLRLDQLAPNGTVVSRLDRPFTREQLAAADLPAGQTHA